MLLKVFFVDWEVTDSGTSLLAPNSNASKKENTEGFIGAKSSLQMRFGQKTEEILTTFDDFRRNQNEGENSRNYTQISCPSPCCPLVWN